MNIIFIAIYITWLVSEILINRLMRSQTSDQQNLDKNTLKIIWITIIVSVTASVFISIHYYAPIMKNIAIRYVGLCLVMVGCILRLGTIKTLGKQFTADVTIRKDHELKTDGIYRFLRHPSYTFSLISFIGFGLSLNNWISLILVVVAMTIVLLMRIHVEEKVLIDQFGDAYLDYRKKTYKLIPPIL